jgi:hypothetical protein
MWKCSTCGEQIDDDRYEFCWKCGSKRDSSLTGGEELNEGYYNTPRFISFKEPIIESSKHGAVERNTAMMSKQDISWLIIRGLGLYLLLEAFMLVPDLLSGIYASYTYSNLLSSLYSSLPSSSGSDNLASLTRQVTDAYRNLLIIPLIKIIFFSVAGFYLIKGGHLFFRLLNRQSGAE